MKKCRLEDAEGSMGELEFSLAKFSQELQKFRNLSENFAMPHFLLS